MEQCVAILTQILARQADNENQGVTIQKRIHNIVPFRGEPGTLVSFTGTIDGVVSEFGGRENEVYNIVYNEKITGAAKDFLAADFPVSWELCKQRLRSHFRPAKEWAVISKEIANIKVFTLSQLVDKIQGIVNNVTECAAFSAESVEMANCLNSMLVVRIKELVAGSLAREISDLYSLESIRAVLYKYIGYDACNLKKDRTSQNNYQHTHRQEKVNRFYNQRTDIVGGNIRRNDRQCYENQFGRRHNKFIVIAIKIPKNYITTDVKLITPLPNEENLEINSEDELIVEVRNDTFVYQPQLMLNELKLSKNCVLDKSCKLIFNNVTKVQIIDDESIIVKNAREMKLEQNCDNRNITLNKNNLLNFYNCEIKILRQTFYNNKQMIKEKYFFPQNQVNYSFEKMITFEEIVSGTIGNLKEIKELKFHKELSRYMYGSFLVILMIIIIIVLVFITRCRVKKAYVIQKIQENFHSKRGGVTYNPNEPDTHLHRPINNIAEQANIPDIPGKSQQSPLTPITVNNTKSTVFANLAEIANNYSV
ncbi:unnamed protein product [Hermetia illucens]|uniref:Uncharacterized protein n=1 Tax=Hermetia illucens TaxID=343691 RepID=A0A7R8UJE1_HERIL|nr:unnamed protein product [Hermetia illucens]